MVLAGAVPVQTVSRKSLGVETLAEQGEATVHGLAPPFPADSA